MAARRRLADTLLLNWIVTLSLLLILLGLVTFVVFLTDPSANRWSEAGKLIGATLFQVGAVTLLLELVHLERLLGSKVPEALLDHGYLDNLKDDRLDDLIERVIRARFSGMSADDARLGRDWLLQSLSAPSRRDYTVTLELKRDDPLTEPFPDAVPAGDGVLCVQITYEYVTDVNATAKPVLINGNGVVQAFRNTIPDTLEFARRFRAGALTPAEEQAWVEKMAQPRIELRPGSGAAPVVVSPQIDNLVVTSGDEGRLLLAFDVKCDHLVLPGERVKVTYRHREYVDRRGYFPWRATALTYNLRVKTKGFEGFDTYPIPAPSLPSEDDKLEVLSDGIYYRGVLYPNSTFTFFWTERAASGQQAATDGR
jgi:hypothetical protein